MRGDCADRIITGATLLDVFNLLWIENQDIVIKGKQIAWVGDTGTWPGSAAESISAKGQWAVPGFGESHKHIESSYVTPEYEAELVIPDGNTWSAEGSHELSNVVGNHLDKSFLTCTPWNWVLVAPFEGNPHGFVNVTNGASHPVVW